MSDRPDVFISDIQKSIILEVKASELVVSDQYPTFYSLRFPRVAKIRYDKDWHEGMNQDQLNELISNFDDARRMNKYKRRLRDPDQSDEGCSSEKSGDDEVYQIIKNKNKKLKVVKSQENSNPSNSNRVYVKDRRLVEFY